MNSHCQHRHASRCNDRTLNVFLYGRLQWYNQIKMDLCDAEDCFQNSNRQFPLIAMLFGLKIVAATYQHVITAVFHDMLDDYIEIMLMISS